MSAAGETCVCVSGIWYQVLESDQGCGCPWTLVSAVGVRRVQVQLLEQMLGVRSAATGKQSLWNSFSEWCQSTAPGASAIPVQPLDHIQ